jgi:hypothetical protein
MRSRRPGPAARRRAGRGGSARRGGLRGGPGQAAVTPEDPAGWGVRLSDRIRIALAAGRWAEAERLCREGDGHARSLAKEYALMYKGLGITLRVLLDLAAAECARASSASAAAALGGVLDAFCRDLGRLMATAYGDAPGPGQVDQGADPVAARVAAARALLAAGEARFDQAQAALADAVVDTLRARDAGRALALLDRKERGQYVPLHDRMIRFMAEVFGWVLRAHGPEALYRFQRAAAEGQRRGFEGWEQLAPAAFARATAFLLKQHMGEVSVREDETRYTIVQTPCGSGGRLRLAGAYDGPGALPFVEAAGPLTHGQGRFPVYCSHCPVWNAVAPMEWFGHPHWVFEDPARPDGSCTLHVYKRRDGAPAGYGAAPGVDGGRR